MNRITENHFSFKCPMNWNEMSPSANGRFCNQCQKEVFDLTNCSLDEVRDLQQKHGSICGSIKLMGAAAVAVSLSAAACQDRRTAGIVAPISHVQDKGEPVVAGRIGPIQPQEKPDSPKEK